MELIDADLMNGVFKSWMHQFGVLSRLSWPGLVYDLPRSFGLKLDTTSTRKLKKWIGVHRAADIGILYRSRKRFGLGLTLTSVHLQKMSVVKYQLLKNSNDPDIRLLYHNREKRNAEE